MSIPSTPLVNDLYQLTMAQGYWKTGLSGTRAAFDYFFRTNPFHGGYTIVTGTEEVLRFLERFSFSASEIDYLRGLGTFEEGFLAYLETLEFQGDVHCVAEGTPAFPMEPVLRVTGPMDQCQLVESTVLNVLNFQSLIATKAARIAGEAGRDSVLEFGLRRAHGEDGSISASRASYVGGCASTSNVQAGMRYGIPVTGTHAHSWVMAFEDELTAFRELVAIYPDSAVLLVDTYDTLASGLPNAITVAREMAGRGHRLRGIRLDSGDLARLSVEARRVLDENGLEDVRVVGSGDLDEHSIRDLSRRHARIDLWGVGTRLVTARGGPSLDGVYKMCAVRDAEGRWKGRLKRSDDPAKATLPGIKQIWRLTRPDGEVAADWIELDGHTPTGDVLRGHVLQMPGVETGVEVSAPPLPMLEKVMEDGTITRELPSLEEIRARVGEELDRLPDEVKPIDSARRLPVLVGPALYEEREKLNAAILPRAEGP